MDVRPGMAGGAAGAVTGLESTYLTEIDVGQNVWKDVSPLHEFSLCSEHYDRVVSLVDRAVSPFREGETTLGMPMAEAAISLGTGHCET